MPKPTTLSTEIWEHIIDILSQTLGWDGRKQALFACGLTCRSWYPRSCLHLYSSVYLRTLKIKAFITSVTLNPSNGCLVRHLDLQGTYGKLEHQTDLILVSVLLLDRLPNLIHISFHNINFAVLHSLFFDHLRRFRNVRYITCNYATASSLHRVAQLVRSFPSLERFVSYRWLQEDSKRLSATPFTNSRLYRKVRVPHLVWHHRSGEEDVLGLFSPSAIVSLNIDYDVGDDRYDPVLLLLQECKGTLRHLELWLDRPEWDKDPSAS